MKFVKTLKNEMEENILDIHSNHGFGIRKKKSKY